MTLFGQTFDAQQLIALISLLALLLFWVLVLGRERSWTRWFRAWEAERKASRQAEGRGDQPPQAPRGPWG